MLKGPAHINSFLLSALVHLLAVFSSCPLTRLFLSLYLPHHNFDYHAGMEFFSSTTISASAATLQRRLTIGDLPHWCESIEKVLSDKTTNGEIFCVWGTFDIRREEINGGVRFSLPTCPNVMQWTVTTGQQPDPQSTVIHATINRTEHDEDFIDSLQQFVDDWKTGLKTHW